MALRGRMRKISAGVVRTIGADSPHRSNCAIAKAESQGAQTANPQIWQKNGDLVPRLGVLSVECHQTELAGLALAHRS
jgi:hypothetical protein